LRELRLADKAAIDAIVRAHPPYSDFTFINLWAWDAGDTAVALHGGNLVVRFADYLSGEPFYMFLGSAHPNETASVLLRLSEREGLQVKLGLIPECVAAQLDRKAFAVCKREDHSDYVLDLQALADCAGRKWHRQRNFIHRFGRETPNARFEILDLMSVPARRAILGLFEEWRQKQDSEERDSDHERAALERCIGNFAPELVAGGISIADRLIAFSIVELAPKPYAINHFEKADRWSYTGVLQNLQWHMALALRERGFRYLNIEQDLGLAGLRKSKQARRPTAFLNKFDVALATEIDTDARQPAALSA
jgi:hypothetical protein